MVALLLKLSLSCVLVFMGVQDFRYRAISWFAFPLLAAGLYLANLQFQFSDFLLILAFVLINYLLITLCFSLREGKAVNILQGYLGLGDVLMILCLGMYFGLTGFFAFYLISLLAISIGTGVYLLVRKPAAFTIPLAGLQSLLLLGGMSVSWLCGYELNEVLQWTR